MTCTYSHNCLKVRTDKWEQKHVTPTVWILATLWVKNKSVEKNIVKNCWSVKILVACTKFSHFLPTKFT